MSEPIRVLAVDDHRMFIDGIQLLLGSDDEISLLGSTGTVDEALQVTLETKPDVLVLDVDLEGRSALTVIPDILAGSPDTKILIVSAYQDPRTIADAIEAGAAGYLPKTHAADRLIEAIKAVAAGEMMLPPVQAKAILSDLRDRMSEQHEADALLGTLTSREKEVLRLLTLGRTTDEIARELFISRFTVRGHVAGMLPKLGVRSKTEAVALAMRLHLVDADANAPALQPRA